MDRVRIVFPKVPNISTTDTLSLLKLGSNFGLTAARKASSFRVVFTWITKSYLMYFYGSVLTFRPPHKAPKFEGGLFHYRNTSYLYISQICLNHISAKLENLKISILHWNKLIKVDMMHCVLLSPSRKCNNDVPTLDWIFTYPEVLSNLILRVSNPFM